jgi:hypothetical protein
MFMAASVSSSGDMVFEGWKDERFRIKERDKG